ncbi:MAG: hypothetical protein RR346_05315 [Bacteroidales bacterium]
MKLVHNILKSLSYTALGLSLLLGLESCEEVEKVGSVKFSLSKEQCHFLSEGGSESIVVTSDEEWTVESNVEWCLVTPGNGNGSVDCELRVDTSYLYKSREAVLTFHSGSQSRQVLVNQLGFEKVIEPQEKELNVPDYSEYGKAFVEVLIVSNVEFDVELPADASWLSYEIEDAHVSSIPRPRKVRFEYGINTRAAERIADVIIKPALDKDQVAVPATVTITQAAAPLIVPGRTGDSLSVVMMARMMRVNNDPSSSGKAMVNWDNVVLKEFPAENGAEGETELRVVGLSLSIFDTYESIPYLVQNLTKLESLSIIGNANGYIRSIEWTPEICTLTNLKYMTISGYGLVTIPDELRNMKSLIGIDLSANYFDEIPVHVLRDLPNLKHVVFTGCRRDGIRDLSLNKDEHIGLSGSLPRGLFELEQLESLHLSYNYFEGSIPDMPVGSMPNLKSLKLNLNFLTGEAPKWILEHPNLGCWEAPTFIFTQENGKDSNGKRVGLTNEPKRFPDCPLK